MPDNHLRDLSNLVVKKGQLNLAEDIASNLRLIQGSSGVQFDHGLNDALELDALLKTSSEQIKTVAPRQQDSFQRMAQLGLKRQSPVQRSELKSDLDMALPELILQPKIPQLILEASQSVFIGVKPDTNNDAAIARAQKECDGMDSAEELQEWQDRQYALKLHEKLQQDRQDEAYALRLSMLPETVDREELRLNKQAKKREKELRAEMEMQEEEELELSLPRSAFVLEEKTMGLFASCQQAMFFKAAPRPSPYQRRSFSAQSDFENDKQPGLGLFSNTAF